MKPSIDFLALALLALTALIAIFLRLRSSDDETGVTTETAEEETLFYRQKALDPLSMKTPVAGLGEGAFWGSGDGYLPADILQLLQPRADEPEDDAASGLASALAPSPKTSRDKSTQYLAWTITAFVILLGLIFLLLWMLSFI